MTPHFVEENLQITSYMKVTRCCYSIDWLQLYCIRKESFDTEKNDYTSPQADKWGNHRNYKLVQSQEYIKGYLQQYAVKWRKYIVAHIAWEPIGVRREKLSCAIKIANPVLYTADWHFILSDILCCLNWSAKNITRVDLACDFNYFHGGLLPETFIRVYLTKSSNTYIRHGSNKWASIGTKEMHKNNFDYIRWGSRQSGISTYLYNKSKELREQKYKPWIAKLWEQHNLDVQNTWRVEFSINSSGRGLKSIADELIHSLFVDDLYKEQAIENLFKLYAQRYFCFYWKPKGGAKLKKDLKKVRLLPDEHTLQVKPTTLYQAQKSARRERMILRELQSFKEELKEEHDYRNYSVLMSLDEIIHQYGIRTHYAVECDMRRTDFLTEIEEQVKEHTSTKELQLRAESVLQIKSDNEYRNEIARQIARKVVSLSAEGILTAVQ